MKVAELMLDPLNPRLPEELQDADQDDLLTYIAEEYEPIEIAWSIASHGYFPSEPVIVVRENNRWVVVEGNRRVTALKLLSSPETAARLGLDEDEWQGVASSGSAPKTIPVIIASSRQKVAPIIGYRHISGIEPWDPWAKARFLATLVDEQGLSFDETGAEVGENTKDVQAHYRNYRILKQARDQFKIPAAKIQKRFGVFTRTMQDPNVLQFIGAPAARDVQKGKDPLSPKNAEKVRKVFSWAFGDDEASPVFTDSRRIVEFGRVLASPEAIDVLETTRNLEEAHIAAGGLLQRLLTRLDKARSNLRAATTDFPSYSDEPEVDALLKDCEDLITEMRDGSDE